MRRVGAPLLVACVAIALAACGGRDVEQPDTTGGGGGNATSTADAESRNATAPRAEAAAGATAPSVKAEDGKRPPVGSDDHEPPNVGPRPGTRTVAAGVPVHEGGDNSVQAFGVEGAVDEREQAFSTLRAYLKARAVGDWARACGESSEQFKEQLATLVLRGRGDQEPRGCTATLRLLLGTAPRSERRRTSEVEKLLSFRVENGYAYVIFNGADGAVRFIAMADDHGEWKVNTPDPAELVAGD